MDSMQAVPHWSIKKSMRLVSFATVLSRGTRFQAVTSPLLYIQWYNRHFQVQ